jgi:hypothetical protein
MKITNMYQAQEKSNSTNIHQRKTRLNNVSLLILGALFASGPIIDNASAKATINGYLKHSTGFTISESTDSQLWAIGKSTLGITLKSDNQKAKLELRPDKTTWSSAVDYLYVDYNALGGKLCVGKQRLGFNDYQHGEYKDSPLRSTIQMKDWGVTYTGKLGDTPFKVAHLGNVSVLDESTRDGKSQLLAVIGHKKQQLGLGYFKASGSNPSSGLALFGGKKVKLSGLSIAGSLYYELDDKTAEARGKTSARQLVGLFTDYKVSNTVQLYADYSLALGTGYMSASKGSPAAADKKSDLRLGVGYKLADSLTAFTNLGLTNDKNNTSKTSLWLALSSTLK